MIPSCSFIHLQFHSQRLNWLNIITRHKLNCGEGVCCCHITCYMTRPEWRGGGLHEGIGFNVAENIIPHWVISNFGVFIFYFGSLIQIVVCLAIPVYHCSKKYTLKNLKNFLLLCSLCLKWNATLFTM